MKWILAPLAGFTDAPFRRLCHEGGADLTYTEMVSAAALAHGHNPTLHLLERMSGEGPVACQVFGATENDLAAAVRRITELNPPGSERRFVAIDLNAGCPMTKVTKCGAGAALVADPQRVARLLSAMRENTDLPITLKTRLGPHPRSTTAFELVDAARSSGAVSVSVHARYASQLHGGDVHYDTLAEVVSRSPLPIVGNGSVTDRASACRMAETGVVGIMIGRAALSNPAIFAALRGVDAAISPDRFFRRHLDYVLEFRNQLAAKFPLDHVPSEDGFASVKLHTHLFRYFNGRPGAAALRARLNSIRTLDEVRALGLLQGAGDQVTDK